MLRTERRRIEWNLDFGVLFSWCRWSVKESAQKECQRKRLIRFCLSLPIFPMRKWSSMCPRSLTGLARVYVRRLHSFRTDWTSSEVLNTYYIIFHRTTMTSIRFNAVALFYRNAAGVSQTWSHKVDVQELLALDCLVIGVKWVSSTGKHFYFVFSMFAHIQYPKRLQRRTMVCSYITVIKTAAVNNSVW